MSLKVIQWATGGVGRAAIQYVIAHPQLELVGCWVHSPDKNGVDAGELAGGEPIGVLATTDADALVALQADCVMYSPVMPDESIVCRLLESGKNVVTPLGWIFPGDRDVSRIESACAAGNTTLHGSGIHPGGIPERFPLMVSALSASITHVRAEEFSDIRTYAATGVVGDIMMFGKTPEESQRSPMAALLTDGFMQSARMVASELGFRLDPQPITRHETAVAIAPIDSPIGDIEPGKVAAQRFTWECTVDGQVVITVRVNWLMGQENLDPPWQFGPEGERFEVEVTGDPSSKVSFHGWHPDTIEQGLERNPGIVATANHCVSAIPYVCDADAGIKTYLDLPLIAGRAAPHLS